MANLDRSYFTRRATEERAHASTKTGASAMFYNRLAAAYDRFADSDAAAPAVPPHIVGA